MSLIKKADLTDGAMTATIFTFCVPLIIGSMIQVLFNMADQMVLGRMAGPVAVASVGACTNAINLVVNTLQGLSVGVTVLLTRALGAREHDYAKRIISTAILAALGIGLFGALTGFFCASPLLRVTNCPENAFRGAMIYIIIYFASTPVIILYNYSAAILRVTGDTARPALYMLFAGLLNVLLNILLCLILPEKVVAVAVATLASQALGAFLTLRRLRSLGEDYRLELRHMVFDRTIFLKLLRYGVPSAINSCVYPLANMLVQGNVNAFDPVNGTSTAGFAVASNVNGILSAVGVGFQHTVTAMVGQNLGAEKPKRVSRSILLCLAYGWMLIGVLTALLMIFREPLLQFYLPDSPEAIEYAKIDMNNLTVFYFVTFTGGVFGSSLNAFGYSFLTGTNTFVGTVVFRPIYLGTVFAAEPTFDALMRIFPVSWALISLAHLTAFSVVYIRYRHGKLKKL